MKDHLEKNRLKERKVPTKPVLSTALLKTISDARAVCAMTVQRSSYDLQV